MSLHAGPRGRHRAQCDGPSCDANVIDLSPSQIEAGRVIVAFFGWVVGSYDSVTGAVPIYCPACRTDKRPRRRAPARSRYPVTKREGEEA
jgi:hypothetical protein